MSKFWKMYLSVYSILCVFIFLRLHIHVSICVYTCLFQYLYIRVCLYLNYVCIRVCLCKMVLRLLWFCCEGVFLTEQTCTTWLYSCVAAWVTWRCALWCLSRTMQPWIKTVVGRCWWLETHQNLLQVIGGFFMVFHLHIRILFRIYVCIYIYAYWKMMNMHIWIDPKHDSNANGMQSLLAFWMSWKQQQQQHTKTNTRKKYKALRQSALYMRVLFLFGDSGIPSLRISQEKMKTQTRTNICETLCRYLFICFSREKCKIWDPRVSRDKTRNKQKNKVTPPVTALLFFHLFSRRFFCVAWPSQRFLCLPICSVAHFGLRFTVFCVC
jgi:hypothetical protein